MSINDFRKLRIGDMLKNTYGADIWTIEVMHVHESHYEVITRTGPGGSGKRWHLDKRQSRRDAARFELLPKGVPT